jgi:hypothetical protein
MGLSPQDATDMLNGIGASGWQMSQNYRTQFHSRRSIFTQAGATIEYLVIDWPTGHTTADLEQLLDGYGVDGWELKSLDMLMLNTRRAVFMRGGTSTGGGGGGIPEAPSDGNTYGRMNTTWNLAIAANNDTIDGGNF